MRVKDIIFKGRCIHLSSDLQLETMNSAVFQCAVNLHWAHIVGFLHTHRHTRERERKREKERERCICTFKGTLF